MYDDMPRAMKAYLSNFGWHFNKKAAEFAIKQMKKKDPSSGQEKELDPWDKDRVDELLSSYGVKLKNDVLYDKVYVCNMGRADLLKSSVVDEAHLALYVKDTLDDIDGSDELPFRFWLQKCVAKGWGVDFEDFM